MCQTVSTLILPPMRKTGLRVNCLSLSLVFQFIIESPDLDDHKGAIKKYTVPYSFHFPFFITR